jgi:hypothetical protein
VEAKPAAAASAVAAQSAAGKVPLPEARPVIEPERKAPRRRLRQYRRGA